MQKFLEESLGFETLKLCWLDGLAQKETISINNSKYEEMNIFMLFFEHPIFKAPADTSFFSFRALH